MSKDQIVIRELIPGEEPQVSALILREFRDHIADSFTEEGIEVFMHIVSPEALAERAYAEGTLFLTAWKGETLVGTIVMRDGNHINLFFVDSACHKQGIGTALLKEAITTVKARYKGVHDIWVQASRNAIPAYQAMGFKSEGKELNEQGIISIRMKKNV